MELNLRFYKVKLCLSVLISGIVGCIILFSFSASSSVPICNRLQSLEADEILASSGPMSTTLSSFGQLPSHSSNKIRSLSVPGADLNLANIDYSNLDKDEWDPLSNFELFREQSDTRKLNLYGGTTLGNLLPQLQPAAYFPTGNARYAVLCQNLSISKFVFTVVLFIFVVQIVLSWKLTVVP